jgi:hypothetical protein
MGGEIRLRHGEVGAAVIVGRLGVQHLCQRQVELLVKQLERPVSEPVIRPEP